MDMDKALLNEIVGWDVNLWARAIDFWDQHLPANNSHINCLDIGAREGGLSLWLAMKGFDVICSDVSDIEQSASVLHKKYSYTGSIKYADLNAMELKELNTYDIIIFKSVLGAIGSFHQPEAIQQSIQNIYDALKPGGKLLFAENLKSTFVHQMARKYFTHWGARWYYPTFGNMMDWLSIFQTVNYQCSGWLSAFGRNEAQRKLLSKTDHLVEKIVPESKRQIMYGVAQK